ncbi:hypothetical protein ACOMHN_062123 [Nucella lapillus]
MVNIISRNNRSNQKLKPEAVQDYIDHMAGVDKSDQLMSYTPFHRKTMKWWKKMFFHLFTLSIIQSSSPSSMRSTTQAEVERSCP